MYLEGQINELRVYESKWSESQNRSGILIKEIESLRIQLVERSKEIEQLRMMIEEEQHHKEREKKSANQKMSQI